MKYWAALVITTFLAGCVMPMSPPAGQSQQPQSGPPAVSQDQAARNFVTAVRRVQPVAEQVCRRRASGSSCDFLILIDDRPGQPANAFQTIGEDGRPVLVFTLALIADARNEDEIAFVMGHETAHHILGHIPQTQRSAQQGALIAGILVAAGGGGSAAVDTAQRLGATVGARTFSKGFELEADALGTEITESAGFSALRGAEFFGRIADPGDSFLGTHPPNAERRATVEQTVARLGR
ncbi:MAG: M48 family metallopeptidase [Pseudorhodobacter sp.]